MTSDPLIDFALSALDVIAQFFSKYAFYALAVNIVLVVVLIIVWINWTDYNDKIPPSQSIKQTSSQSIKQTPSQTIEQTPSQPPSALLESIFTKNELSFFKLLTLITEDNYAIVPKIRIGDIIDINVVKEHRQLYSNSFLAFFDLLTYSPKPKYHLNQMHVDFLICDKQTFQPLLGIELDDSSHQNPENQRRDREKDSVFQSVGLPLLRVVSHQYYRTRELASKIETLINSENKSVVEVMQ